MALVSPLAVTGVVGFAQLRQGHHIVGLLILRCDERPQDQVMAEIRHRLRLCLSEAWSAIVFPAGSRAR